MTMSQLSLREPPGIGDQSIKAVAKRTAHGRQHLRYIDAFDHFLPKALWGKMRDSNGAARDIGKGMRNFPAIGAHDTRFKFMDQFDDNTQVISHDVPPIEAWGAPEGLHCSVLNIAPKAIAPSNANR